MQPGEVEIGANHVLGVERNELDVKRVRTNGLLK
jgi:hypothetical protein